MAKEFTFRGKTLEELKSMDIKEFSQLVKSRSRRTLTREMPHSQKVLLKKLKSKDGVETHSREMVIVPQMLGKTIKVHDGKIFQQVRIIPEMLGHRLGEYALTRRRVEHHAPGIGATRSSSSLSVK